MKTRNIFGVVFIVLAFGIMANAQTTAFNYQGSLKTGGSPANGNYDFEFALFDALSAGTQLGSTLTKTNIAVADGVFSVSLDFGNQFPGANRFLEIRVRPNGGGAFTLLTPRQQISNSPYSVRSLNAANADTASNASTATTANNAFQLGGVAANQYVLTTDPRMTDARSPLSGSGNYIQNTTTQQASSNFSITGNGIIGGTLGIGAPPGSGLKLDVAGRSRFRQASGQTGGMKAPGSGSIRIPR